VALLAALLAVPAALWSTPAVAVPQVNPSVLVVTAHPDDETMTCMGRFRERGWCVVVALVTNGESGEVVQSICSPCTSLTGDALVERLPGPHTWVVRPPAGPRLRRIVTPAALAAQRRREFLAGQSFHRVTGVYFLSGLYGFDFEDSWDDGITHWDTSELTARLRTVARAVRPDVVVTLNPDETWAHPQHQGLGRIVRALHAAGGFDTQGRPRPALYGIREQGWYAESLLPQSGDEEFDRRARSGVLRRTYAEYWAQATSAYVSQSSHPVWFAARVRAGILPGYGDVDVVRRLDGGAGQGLEALFEQYPPDRAAMERLPRHPRVTDLSGG
jgi:LmbE family N-acetylglucosaminyl deacetylase